MAGMRWLWLSLICAGCSSGNVHYTGSEHPIVAGAGDIEMLGRDVPPGHDVIGVATGQCETLDGASGLLERPCNEASLVAQIREHAASVGGTGIVDEQCSAGRSRREVTNVDGGGVETSVRAGLTCRATVVRRVGGASAHRPAPDAGAAAPRPAGATRRVTIGDAPVEVAFDGTPATPREADAVGEMDAFPAGYLKLGRVMAECVTGCPRSTARRALRHEAARIGAIAVAAIDCALVGERWRCEADAVGDAVDAGSGSL